MKIVVVGGGFGGVKTALELSKVKGMQVTLVSDRDHLLFYPALYATATGRRRSQSIISLEDIFEGKDVRIYHDLICGLDVHRKTVVGAKKAYQYDKVIFALGVVTSYFDIDGLDKYSYSIKTANELKKLKNHLHKLLSRDRHMDKNYVVVGAGPTGVELAASLASYLSVIADNHDIKRAVIRVMLVEASQRVLPRLSETSSMIAQKRLRHLGVKIQTNHRVEREDKDGLIVDGREIPSETVIWTSGVTNNPFFIKHAQVFRMAENGRVQVDEHMQAYKDVFVIGDSANTKYSGLAQTAVYDAVFVARVIKRIYRHSQLPDYKPRRPVTVIPIGHNWALLEYRNIRIHGRFASLIRRLADFIAYLELLSAARAWRLWIDEDTSEEDCPTCKKSLR